jgi:outer membrane protein assembly factor BamA
VYTQVTGWTVSATFNVSFRPPKYKEGNLSFVYTNFQYTQYKQIILVSLSNLYSKNDKWFFPGEIRYFNFPTNTFGLGSSTLPTAIVGIDYSHFRFYRSFLKQMAPHTYLGVGYNLDYRWKITDNNVQNGVTDDFVKYGYTKTSSSSGPSFSFLYDTRDNPNLCLQGAYLNVQFVSYLKPLGSNSNWNSLLIEMRKFVPLSKKWYTELAFWGYAWLTLNGKPPYLDLPSNGWDAYNNTGREYVAGRYRGLSMLYFETEFRFDILRNGILGAVVFGNLGSFTERNGNFFGPVQPGGGAGLRVKFNKNMRSNACLDYGFGSHGARGFADNINEVF